MEAPPVTDPVSFSFEIPGNPRGKGRPKFARRGNFVRTYTDDKTASYENLVTLAAKAQMRGMEPFKGAVSVGVICFFPIPKATPKKFLAEMRNGGIRHIKKIDADNCAKAVLDGLNHVAFVDDAQVARLLVEKFYGDTPRVVVTVTEIHP